MKIIDINSIPRNPSENDKAKAKSVSLKHSKRKWYVVGFCITFLSIAALLVFFYLKETKNVKAEDDIFQAIYHFEAGDFDKALKGEGSHKGFLQVIEQYPYTTTANIACFYAGIAYMHQKEYETARSFLSRFKVEDYILQARSWSVIGDAYSEQKNYKQAAAYYIKAARYRPNSVYTPVYLVKAASAFEADGQYENGYRCYQEIVEKYPNSSYGSGLAIKEASRLSAFFINRLIAIASMQKRWVIQSFKPYDKVSALEKVLGTPSAISTILVEREIETFEAAKHFFRPALEQLYDPFLMQGMERAVGRLHQALTKKEKILIYGDYDVDGTTAVAMVYGFLDRLPGAVVSYYVPDRMVEGYGVSMQAIEKAHQDGIKLIITLDCGIKAYEPIALAVERGIDVMVCDHHEVGDVLPLAYEILNPKQPGCSYPFKELSGCGIGFKLLQAFCSHCGLNPATIYGYLDLVAVSTACDIVPLVDENRILAYFGLKQLATQPRPGLQALIELGGLTTTITISDIVFKIGPRINAAGRMSHASLAVELLIEQDLIKAYHLAQSIDQQNCLRQSLDDTITQEALAMIVNKTHPSKTNVLFKPDWHKGIIGIVASRCIEQCYRPTVVLTLSDGKATGSARSISGYNIYEAISACSGLLHQYGGHAFAAGLTMPLDHVAKFQKQFEEVVSETITDDLLIPQQPIHALIPFQTITQKFLNILMQMAPFGPGNATPIFASEKVYARKFYLIKGKHLKLELYQTDCLVSYEAIGFGLGSYFPLVATGKPFAIAYTVGYNYYLGHKSLQLIVKDIKETVCMA